MPAGDMCHQVKQGRKVDRENRGVRMGSALYEAIGGDLAETWTREQCWMVALWGKRVPSRRSKKCQGSEEGIRLGVCFFSKDSFILQTLPPFTLSKTSCREQRRHVPIIRIRKLRPRKVGLLSQVNKS